MCPFSLLIPHSLQGRDRLWSWSRTHNLGFYSPFFTDPRAGRGSLGHPELNGFEYPPSVSRLRAPGVPQTSPSPSVWMILFKNIYFFIYWLCCVLLLCVGYSLVVESGGYSLLVVHRLWGSQALVVVMQWGPGALWHVESSWTRDQTCVLCIGWWILNH